MRIKIAAIAALAMVIPAGAIGDTVRMKSGSLVEGRVQDLGDRLSVEQDNGTVSLRWRDVDVVLRDQTARDLFGERYAATDKTDADALYKLALWAEQAGLATERKDCLEKALAANAEHRGARDALAQQKQDGKWLGGEKLLTAKGFVSRGGQWLLAEEAQALDRQAAPVVPLSSGETRAETLIERAGSADERVAKLANEALSGLDTASLRRPALRVLRRGKPRARAQAATVLARVDDIDIVRPLIHSAILDQEALVRTSAVAALKGLDMRDVPLASITKPFTKALFSQSQAVRMNAAEGLGGLGGPVAVEYLVRRLQSAGGLGIRNHIAVGRQFSYVADFDVEIAQAAQIGDPIVGTLREGVMLDTRVLGVVEQWTEIERRVVYGALRRTTGQEIGQDPVAWKDWWEKEKAGRSGETASLDSEAADAEAANAETHTAK